MGQRRSMRSPTLVVHSRRHLTPEENERLVAETVEHFGAWTPSSRTPAWHAQPLADATREDWDFIMGVNLHGVLYGCRAAAAQMRRQGEGGSIVVISSVNAVMLFSPLGCTAPRNTRLVISSA